MENFLEIFNQYARSELLILVPVLYIIGKILMTSKLANERIPLILSGISIVMCSVYTFSTVPILNVQTALLALFTSVTQGILFAGASVLGGVMLKPDCFASMMNSSNKENEKK